MNEVIELAAKLDMSKHEEDVMFFKNLMEKLYPDGFTLIENVKKLKNNKYMVKLPKIAPIFLTEMTKKYGDSDLAFAIFVRIINDYLYTV